MYVRILPFFKNTTRTNVLACERLWFVYYYDYNSQGRAEIYPCHTNTYTHIHKHGKQKKHAALGIRWRKQCFLDDWCFLFFFDKRHRFGSPRFAKKLAPNNQNEPNADELSPTWYGAPKQVNVYHTQTLILLHYLAVCCGTRDSEHFFREQIKCLL